ncbi:D-glycero-alpha-D-manno-heptose 1-phosphate guanylyltransferase [Desulfacinum hydrothermale DSM 13146]|uniref:D-glycero-alpha-D-manno-heptose 1-phosphate guanylyltransferase n=1 Tax=Desulfacinum hydrothermale DSM 13146 TaxID=1121390 RepID=A0A1W1XS10_9BACT|nr:nucleotidyltransferase family protein [Desulfacinum hydrothermale]SMC26308.1 D-glycero-alpha-D-manno-heptose 1-phosphate guanylyltransferase [Desulfacinum hydrothermale DSM 13146]
MECLKAKKHQPLPVLVLAGGLGTRLRPEVPDRPKALARVAGEPFLGRLLRWLKAQGLERVVLCVGYLWERIADYVGDGAPWGLEVVLSVEETPLGTAGALKNAERYVQGPFFVLNGDTFLDVSLAALARFHEENGWLATLAVTHVEDGVSFGVVEMDSRGRLLSFNEKKGIPGRPAWINGGVYLLERRVLGAIAPGRAVSLEKEVLPGLLDHGEALGCFPARGTFLDIGTPDRYRKSQKELEHLP